jgi:hypothetical protein
MRDEVRTHGDRPGHANTGIQHRKEHLPEGNVPDSDESGSHQLAPSAVIIMIYI